MVGFEPEGDFEYEWLALNTDAEPYQWMGRTLWVDQRYAEVLLDAVRGAGWVWEVVN